MGQERLEDLHQTRVSRCRQDVSQRSSRRWSMLFEKSDQIDVRVTMMAPAHRVADVDVVVRCVMETQFMKPPET